MPTPYPSETNNIGDYAHAKVERSHIPVHWSDPELAQIVRIRLVTDPGFPMWDVSYIHGVMKDGTHVRVNGLYTLPRKEMLRNLYAQASADGVYLKRLLKGAHIEDVLSKIW